MFLQHKSPQPVCAPHPLRHIMNTLRLPSKLPDRLSVKRHGQRHPPAKPTTRVCRAQSTHDFNTVMCSRLAKPKVAVLEGCARELTAREPSVSPTNVIVDGSAFKVPGKTVTSEYFHMLVNNDLNCGFSRALQLQIFKTLRDVEPCGDPIYYVAVVQPIFDETLYMYDIEGLQCYLACYQKDRFTFHRAIFGPELISELREVMMY